MNAVAQFKGFDEQHLASFGHTAGSERMMLHAEVAEKSRPQLVQFDAYGVLYVLRSAMQSRMIVGLPFHTHSQADESMW